MSDAGMRAAPEKASCGMIYKAIAGVMEDVGAVGKTASISNRDSNFAVSMM